MNFLKKYHKWISVIFTFFILMFSFSGIILNHRKLLSGIDVSRTILPNYYSYKNWNNAAVKSTLKISKDSILIYGNIGIWLTDNNHKKFTDFNSGLPKGIDNRKICKLFKTKNNQILAGTQFGLYQFSAIKRAWQKIKIPVPRKRIVDITEKDNQILILTRSHLFSTTDLTAFNEIKIPAPKNYNNKIGLFKTMWVIHSGEIFGESGKFVVDILGLILAFITISGFIIFMNKIAVKRKKTRVEKKIKKLKNNKWLINWHNKLGWTTALFLIVVVSTGIFLRPPFLIPIADQKVGKIPFTELDTDNPWFDQLRRILYDNEADRFIIATSENVYYSDDNFKSALKKFKTQPLISVMGVNVLRKEYENTYLVGSFEGLYLWNTKTNEIIDYIKKIPYIKPEKKSRPIGEFMITGFSDDFEEKEIYFDYNNGAFDIRGNSFTSMPEGIKNQPISLWNLALEHHTGRIFQFALSDFYILIVPLTGLALLFIIVSGFIVWWKQFRKVS